MNLISGRLRSIWTIFWKSAVFVCLWGMLYTPFIIAFKDHIVRQANSFSPQTRLYVEATGVLAVLAAGWIMVRFIDRRPFRTLGFARGHVGHDILIGVGIGTVWLGLSLLALWIMGCVSMRSSFTVLAPSLVWAAAALLLNTVTQEVLVRSYIYQTIKSQSNFIWAIVGSSILFTLAPCWRNGGSVAACSKSVSGGCFLWCSLSPNRQFMVADSHSFYVELLDGSCRWFDGQWPK